MSVDLDSIDFSKWSEEDKERLLTMIDDTHEAKAFYCNRGRTCDGKPHEGYDYRHARGDQWPPPAEDDWFVWLLKGGRGSGKTRSGAEWVRTLVTTDAVPVVFMIGPTADHVRATMVEGDGGGSALLEICEAQKIRHLFEPSKRRITFPGHDVTVRYFSGEEPDRLRGPQSGAAWLDEPAHIARIEDVWSNLLFGLRLPGRRMEPKVLCSTTPLPTKWMKDLVARKDTVSVTASTYANLENLSPVFRKTVLEKYEGTRLGRQELMGEILEDVEGALWSFDMIDAHRDFGTTHEQMERIVVAIDPSGTSTKKRDETGIVVVGKIGKEFYVLDDVSGHYTPDGWAAAAWKAYDKYGADAIVAEKNYGGEMVSSTLRSRRQDGLVKLVTSRRGKALRAEPIVGLYEQGRVHHTRVFSSPEVDGEGLEEQMTQWVPGVGDSPDRVDALVHGITELNVGGAPASIAAPGRGAADRTFGQPLVTRDSGLIIPRNYGARTVRY